MHEGQAREDIQTGIDAKNLKNNPVFKIIFENIEKELLDLTKFHSIRYEGKEERISKLTH